MEKRPFLICDERQREICKHGPNCEHLAETEHHLRPRRLLQAARKAKMDMEYQRKLKTVIHHPNNIVIAPRCIHDHLDKVVSDILPVEEELDHTIEVWSRNDG